MADHSELSRREFVAASVLGLVGMASVGRSDDELLYVGTYTEGNRADGIYLVRFDGRSGALRQVGAVNAGENPSFLAIHPNGRVLYAVNEVERVDRTDVSVVQPTDVPTATLITCTGVWLPQLQDYSERLIVRAELASGA